MLEWSRHSPPPFSLGLNSPALPPKSVIKSSTPVDSEGFPSPISSVMCCAIVPSRCKCELPMCRVDDAIPNKTKKPFPCNIVSVSFSAVLDTESEKPLFWTDEPKRLHIKDKMKRRFCRNGVPLQKIASLCFVERKTLFYPPRLLALIRAGSASRLHSAHGHRRRPFRSRSQDFQGRKTRRG